MLNKIIITTICCIAYLGVHAQSVGYLHQDSVLRNVPRYMQVVQDLVQAEQTYNTEIKQEKEAVDTKLQKILQQYKVSEGETIAQLKKRMKANDTLSLNLTLAENAMIDNKRETYATMLQSRYNQELQPLLDKVNDAISTYAKEQKLDAIYILDSMAGQLAYVNEKKVITADIISMVNKS